MADIYVFGDSIGYGAVDEKGGWVDRLKQCYHKKRLEGGLLTEVVNLSIDGDTSSDIAIRIKDELKVRRKPWSTSSDLVVIAIGGNDSCAEGSPDGYKASTKDYTNNLNTIYELVKYFGLTIAFIGITGVDESKTNPCIWGEYYIDNSRVSEFNAVQKEFCEQKQIPRIDLFEETLKPEYKNMLFDGVHPNTEGHQWMFDMIKPFIEDLLQK